VVAEGEAGLCLLGGREGHKAEAAA
jgi:hypothetical protein